MFATPPMMNLLVLRSSDMERASQFYKKMGMFFTKHRHGSGPEHYVSEVAGFVFEIYPIGTGAATTSTRIGFSVDDVDSIVVALTAIGGKVVSKTKDSNWGRRAVMKDFDGHTVELVSPLNRDKIVASSEVSTGVITETQL